MYKTIVNNTNSSNSLINNLGVIKEAGGTLTILNLFVCLYACMFVHA